MKTLIAGRNRLLIDRIVSHVRAPLFRNGYLLTLSSVGSAGFGLVFWALAAHLYPAEVIGLQSAALSTMMLVAGIAVLGLNNVLIRYVQAAGPTTARLIGSTYVISVAASVVISLTCLKGLVVWFPTLEFLGGSFTWIMAFVLATAAWCVFSLQDFALTGLRQTQWIPIENLLFSFAKIVLLLVFARLPSDLGIFAAWNIPVVLSLLPINWLIFRHLVPEFAQTGNAQTSPPKARQVVSFAAGNYLGSLFSIATVNLLPILVVTLGGARANAHFYLPWVIVSGLQLLALSMTTSLTVEAIVNYDQLAAYCRRVLVHVARLLIPIVIIILIGAPYILRIFGPEYAVDGAALLRWLTLATLPNLILMLGLSLARVENRAGTVAIIQGLQGGLGLGLSALVIQVFGLPGVGMAWLLSQTAVAVFVWMTILRPVFTSSIVAPASSEKSLDIMGHN